MQPKKLKPFDPITVDLQGSNLVEASAGTGKTYSIAILVLRLLLENQISLKNILMVTFTNAAVAELEDRVRQFVRQAHKYACEDGGGVDDGVAKAVERAYSLSTPEQVKDILNRAVLLMDETSILTIHSFCQQTLTECAFETGQLFGAELMTDDTAIMEEAVNRFWREQVVTLPVPLLEVLHVDGLKKKALNDLVSKVLSGKKYIGPTIPVEDTCLELYQQTMDELEAAKGDILERVKTEGKNLLESFQQSNGAFLVKVLSLYYEKRSTPTHYIHKFTDIVEKCQAFLPALYCQAIRQVVQHVQIAKQRASQLQYDDLIKNVHHAVCCKKDAALLDVLRCKYKAVFIDEFQDTDRMQFDIFGTTFHQQAIVFYIGDPKQSIYGFRKADLDVYFEAFNKKDIVCHTMEVNHRSSPSMVEAMNAFFQTADPFYYGSLLPYRRVNPSHRKKDSFYKAGVPDKPITVVEVSDVENIPAAVSEQVWQLLQSGQYALHTSASPETIRPSDIGILVRWNYEAKAIKKTLAERGIPAVTVDDTKLLETEEARYLLYWLQACLQVNRGNINRALLSPFTGLNADDLLLVNEDEAYRRFRRYNQILARHGVYKALSQFMLDYDVRKMTTQATSGGDRTLANLLHLAELLLQVQTQNKYTPVELVSWLQRGMESGAYSSDEYQQRMESDEQAVKIVTIHKSKGLEYKIVLAPYLDLENEVKSRHAFCSFKENSSYVVAETKKLTSIQKALYQTQTEQENRRLIYVAITRAIYKCYLYKQLENGEPVNSSLQHFYNGCIARAGGLLEAVPASEITKKRYESEDRFKEKPSLRPLQFELSQRNWCKMSFTYLAAKGHAAGVRNEESCGDGYDDFIFRQMKKGEKTGLMLHSIFEHIDFSREETWEPVIKDTLSRYLPGEGDAYAKYLKELLYQVLHTPISCNGETLLLSKVDCNHRINEFEFDYNVKPFDLQELSVLLDHQQVKFRYENQKALEGVMYGVMDLFFAYGDKFYILDWKSNHLGYTADDYHKDAIETAMRENNYHLQYLLYTMAAKKYLESRLGEHFCYERDFGGVIYLFVRGVREGGNTGIFTCHPPAALLNNLSAVLDVQHNLSVVGIPASSETAALKLKKQHFTGTLIQDLMRVLRFHEILARPDKYELLYSDEEVSDGQMYYFTPSYHGALLESIRESMAKGALQALIKDDRSFRLLNAMESAIEVFDKDIDGINLIPLL